MDTKYTYAEDSNKVGTLFNGQKKYFFRLTLKKGFDMESGKTLTK